MNEATLESRIDSVLYQVFPTFKEVKVEHQTSFTLKIGHHNIPFESNYSSKNTARGISDIILKIGGRNVILLELKQENVKISLADIDQGISYARLLDPMPPITLISNSKVNKFFNTYTKKEIIIDSIDLEMINKYIANSFALAANDFKDALNLLLNNDPELFSKVINGISSEKFEALKGAVNNFDEPICGEFNVERTILNDIESLFSKDRSLIGVGGAAFSGKTTLLYQFYQKVISENNFAYYIDCNDINVSILQSLANTFSIYAKSQINLDKIREWFISSLSNLNESRIYLLLDNFNYNIPDRLMGEIIEIIDLFKNSKHRILYTIDEFNYKEIANVKHRNYKTVIGKNSTVLKLKEFDEVEYETARDIMFNSFKITIEHGGSFTEQYREPRILRYLISAFYDLTLKKDEVKKIVAVPDYELLQTIANNKIYPNRIHQLFKKIAICFVEELEMRKKISELSIAAIGSGAILTETFKTKYPNDYDELIQSSMILIRNLPRVDQSIIYPKLPELIAYYCIDPITQIIIEKSMGMEKLDMANLFIKLLEAVPLSDIVGAAVLLELSQRHPAIFTSLLIVLRGVKPRIESITEGTSIIMHMEDIGHVNIDFATDINPKESSFLADYLPYAVLSQLAGYPMERDYIDEIEKDELPYQLHLELILDIASDPHLFIRPSKRSFLQMKCYENYDWDGVGQIVNGNEGIIEAIVQSIQKCFLFIPDDLKLLYEYGFRVKNFTLLYRFYLALNGLTYSVDAELADKAKTFVLKFHHFFAEFMASYISSSAENIEEQKDLYNNLMKMKIDEEFNRLITEDQ